MGLRSRLLNVFAAMIVVWAASSVATAEVKGDLSLLKRVADLQRANLSRLKQWTGEAELEFREEKAEGNYKFTERVAVRYAHDIERDAICFRWTVLESFARKDGEDDLVNSLKGGRIGALHLGDDQYRMSLTLPKDPCTVTLSGRAKVNIGDMSQLFYPMSYFRISGEDCDNFFRDMCSIADRDWALLEIRSDRDTVTLVSSNKTLAGIEGTHVFDLSKAGCMVNWRTTDPSMSFAQSTEYVLLDGVWLPSKVVYRDARHDNSEISEKTVRWIHQEINRPIPDSAFTLEAMGVPAGATVFDRRVMTTYTYQPPNTIPGTESVSEPVTDVIPESSADSVDETALSLPEAEASNRFLVLAAIFSVLAVLVIISVVLIKTRRRSREP